MSGANSLCLGPRCLHSFIPSKYAAESSWMRRRRHVKIGSGLSYKTLYKTPATQSCPSWARGMKASPESGRRVLALFCIEGHLCTGHHAWPQCACCPRKQHKESASVPHANTHSGGQNPLQNQPEGNSYGQQPHWQPRDNGIGGLIVVGRASRERPVPSVVVVTSPAAKGDFDQVSVHLLR